MNSNFTKYGIFIQCVCESRFRNEFRKEKNIKIKHDLITFRSCKSDRTLRYNEFNSNRSEQKNVVFRRSQDDVVCDATASHWYIPL